MLYTCRLAHNMEDEDIPPNNSVDDWLEQQEQLPVRCPSFIELRYTRHFAVDVNGVQGHDHYVYIAPNGVAVMGLAPSHVMITAYKKSKADGSLSAGKHQEGGVVSQKAEPEETQGVAGEHATGDNTEDAGVGPAQTAGPREPSKSSENGGEEAGVGQGEGEDGQVSASATQHQPPEQLNRKRRRGGGQSGEPDNQAVHFFPPEQLAKVNFDLGKRSATTKQSGKKRGQGSHLDAGTVVCKLESSAGPW